MTILVTEQVPGMEHRESGFYYPLWVSSRGKVYDLSQPDRGRGWFGLYKVSGEYELELRRANLPLWRVRQELVYNISWYARSTPALPLIRLRFWLTDQVYWWFLVEVLYHRLHLVTPSAQGLIFQWRRDFRPLAWIRKICG